MSTKDIHESQEPAPPLGLGSSEGLGAGAEAWESWKAQVDAIADAEGLTPKANPLPGELDVWRKHWQAGKTPAQAWRAVPYKRRFG
jgi:hypothetical protein